MPGEGSRRWLRRGGAKPLKAFALCRVARPTVLVLMRNKAMVPPLVGVPYSEPEDELRRQWSTARLARGLEDLGSFRLFDQRMVGAMQRGSRASDGKVVSLPAWTSDEVIGRPEWKKVTLSKARGCVEL